MPFNVFPLVNTCHALGFSAFLMVDALISSRCHLQAMEMRLNASVTPQKYLRIFIIKIIIYSEYN